MSSAPPLASPRRSAGWLDVLFGIDARSLACFRIGLGVLLLWDLYGRAKTLRVHYTGEGAFPRELAADLRPDSLLFHAFLWSDRFEVQAALFVLFALVALGFALGWHTRLTSVLAFVLLASLVRRNPYVCHTGDVLLKALSFWAMFLPLGAHFSLDRLRGRTHPPAGARALSLATAGVLLQVAIFYLMAGYLKTRYEVWQRGEAVWIFTHVLEYTRPFGAWLGQFPALCRLLTFATLVLECLAPFLLFFPFGTSWIRPLLCFTLAGFHLTLQSVIHIGIFQMLCIVMLTLGLSREFWDALPRFIPSRLRHALSGFRDGFVARLGRHPRGGAPHPAQRWLGGAAHAFLVPVLAVILVSNLNSAVEDPYDPEDRGVIHLPQWVDDYGRQMSLVQSWNMFTDIGSLFFGWFLVLAQQEDGTLVDVLERKPFGELRLPEHYARFFPNHNSRRYWRNLTRKDGAGPFLERQQHAMCTYLAREWERASGKRLVHMALFHVGRVPAQKRARDQVKPISVDWEAAHEPLKAAAPEVQRRWADLRARWARFLESLPKSVPASS